jgi:uncharacterized protein
MYAEGEPCFVELVTPDPAAAAEFYAATFGWAVDGDRFTLDGEVVAGLSPLPPTAEVPAFWATYLAVADLDAVAGRVEAAGGTVWAGPFDVGTRGRTAAVQDPTGVMVNLWQAGTEVGTARTGEPGWPTGHRLSTPDPGAAQRFFGDVFQTDWSVSVVAGPARWELTVVGLEAPLVDPHGAHLGY